MSYCVRNKKLLYYKDLNMQHNLCPNEENVCLTFRLGNDELED